MEGIVMFEYADNEQAGLTAYGFPVERAAYESYEAHMSSGNVITFYTVSLEGLVINGKRYERVTVEYKYSAHRPYGIGEPYVTASADHWNDIRLTESARRKIEEAAREHARETFWAVLGSDELRKDALRGILARATREEFDEATRRGSMKYLHRYTAFPFTNGSSDWRMICSAMGATLSDEEVIHEVRTTWLQCLRGCIADLERAVSELED